MITSAITWLVRIDFPGDTARLSDGAIVKWGADVFLPRHPTFGAIGGAKPIGEGMGDEVPSLELMLIPDDGAAGADLWNPAWQGVPATFWISEYTPATGVVVGTPSLVFAGMIDTCKLTVGGNRRDLTLGIVASVEKLFEKNIGNGLNSAFHKSVWSGETGLDNATGLSIDIAWGTEKPGAMSAGNSSGGSPWGAWR